MNDPESLEQLKYESDSLLGSLAMANSLKGIPDSALKYGYSLIMRANKILNKDIKVSDFVIDKLTEEMYHYADSLEVLYVSSESNAIKIPENNTSKLLTIRGKIVKPKSKRKTKRKLCSCKKK